MSSSGLLRRQQRLRKEYLYRKSLEGTAMAMMMVMV